METLLVKIFATALALSQVTTAPDAVKTQFDRDRDQAQVAQLLRAGCTHMLKAFDIEDINLDDLIATAMDDPQAIGETKAFRGINFADLQTAYRQFCKNEKVAMSAVDLGDVIDFYNKAAANLPDHTKLKGLKLPGASVVLDRKGERFAEVFEENQRRVWVPLADIPEHVRKPSSRPRTSASTSTKGIDERGLIRAFIGNLAASGRPQGGSTITQQIVKNLLVGEDLTYERKIREMIVAARLEIDAEQGRNPRALPQLRLSRPRLLGHRARRAQLFRQAGEGTDAGGGRAPRRPDQGAELFQSRPASRPGAGAARLCPEPHARGRRARAQASAEPSRGAAAAADLVAYERPRRDIGFHFVDQVAREAKSVGRHRGDHDQFLHGALDHHPAIAAGGRGGAAGGAVALRAQQPAASSSAVPRPTWPRPSSGSKPTTSAPTSGRPGSRRSRTRGCRSTTCTGRPLWWWRSRAARRARPGASASPTGASCRSRSTTPPAQRKLTLYDVVLVRLVEGKGKAGARAELRVRPVVQGTVVVLENKTGRILAMTGGFSYPLSQLNRATQAVRQPGSAIKPLSYLAALGKGLQPNTLVSDEPITLPPIGGGRAREQDYWTPKNYDGGGGGTLTLRRALENSRNLATVHLLDGGIEGTPEASLDRLCKLALEAQIYRECVRYYPFVLGAQPVRPVDLAAFYAAIANEGLRPAPHVIDSIERNGSSSIATIRKRRRRSPRSTVPPSISSRP